MKTISAALTTFFLTGWQATGMSRADLITILLPNGTTLNVLFGTNTDITYSGTLYSCSRFGAWERGPITSKAAFTISAESWELTAIVSEAVMYPGTSTPLMQAINAGMLNGARVSVQTLYWPTGSPPSSGFSMGTMQLTVGQIGNIKNTGRTKITCEVFDLTYILNRPVPPHNIQSACRHSLFDAGCTLLLANFVSTNVPLASGSSSLYLNLNVPGRASGTPYVQGNVIIVASVIYMCTTPGTSAGSAPTFLTARGAVTIDGGVHWTSQNQAYPLGYVIFASGQNAGLKASIKMQGIVAGVPQFQLSKPLPFPVAPGDNVQLVPGCDKTLATCENVFNNLIHIGAMPFVPNPEVAQ